MKKVFLDLEMNPTGNKGLLSDEILKREIIEIGAVMLDENDNEISSFDEYVRPMLNEVITTKITKLTGITTEDVASADIYPNVIRRFIEWCGNDCEIYSWSENDMTQLKKESIQKEVILDLDDLLFSKWKDFQILFMDRFGFEKLIPLSMAVNLAGLDFQGKAHGALADAQNTAFLYKRSKEKQFEKLIEELNNEKEDLSVNLGSLFDFAKLAS